ncbi:MAG: hypothetical protein H6753_05230 [Candidatus Omnitrophica bacterium]|nr:hypothetical protein [Candidatus Omnitrophota bacterium]
MLFKISLLTALLFSTMYPLSFWISADNPLKNNFHRFHLGVACVVAGLCALIFYFSPIAIFTHKISLIVWAVLLLFAAGYYYQKPAVNPTVITFSCLLGIIVTFQILNTWAIFNYWSSGLILLGGIIFCAALFAMNLGHWYLNVSGLPLSHLRRAVYIFWAAVALRALIDGYILLTTVVFYHGEVVSLLTFLRTIEGFMLIIGILFGTIFPLICLYFVKGTLDVKSTQSATGILYAILCAVVIGDITYKYYFLKYGVIL